MGNYQMFDYDFEAESHSDYKLKILFKVKNKLMKLVFNKSLLKLSINPDNKDIDKIERFQVEKKYFKLIKSRVYAFIKIVQKEIRPDRIKMINYSVDNAFFVRIKDSDKWEIELCVSGQYVKGV